MSSWNTGTGWARTLVTLLLGLAGCAPVGGLGSEPVARVASTLPTAVVLPDVPFISWHEAALMPHIEKATINPSFAASLGMVLRYWGQPLSMLQSADLGLPKSGGGWGKHKGGTGGSIDDLKAFVARGIPVIVYGAVTPVAHAPSPVATGLAFRAGVEAGGYGFVSGILGRMISLDAFPKVRRAVPAPLDARERVFDADRVVIGYDDHRGIIVLHDPSFGPAWEVPYGDFSRMWEISERQYAAIWRRDEAPRRPAAAEAVSYRRSTPDEEAARRFTLGYALSSVGKAQEAEKEFRAGLAIHGVSDGYRHLFLLELVPLLTFKGDQEAALATAREAVALLPEHHRGWKALARLYWRIKTAEMDGKAAEAETRAQDLSVCMPETMIKGRWEVRRLAARATPPPQRRVATAVAHDFLVAAACTQSDVVWMLARPE